MASNATDQRDNARPRFHVLAVQNMAKSEAEGRPIFDQKEMVEVKIPGDKLLTWVGEVEQRHRERWPEQYAAFKRGEERAASGTPIESWPNPLMTASRVAELKACNILSVEELSGIPDNALPKLGMGARELREQARTYISAAKDGAANSALSAEVARLREQIERMAGGQAAPAEPATAEPLAQPASIGKPVEDCTDEELKAYIKVQTGKAPRGNPSRDTLLKQASDIALGKVAA